MGSARTFAPSAVLAILVALLLCGCEAVSVLPPPSDADAELVAANSSSARCAVTGARGARGRPALATALRSTGLFAEVVATDASGVPAGFDWVVEEWNVGQTSVFRTVCPDNATLTTILTLGLFPIIRHEGEASSFVVRRPDAKVGSGEPIFAGGPVTAVGGWAALPLLLTPWWWTTPESGWRTDREAQLLAVAICRRGLLGAPPGDAYLLNPSR